MAAVVSGNSLGLFNTSLYVLGSQAGTGQAAQGRAGERVYVNAATGNLVVQNRDELVLGRGPDIGALRTYNSQGMFTDDNGDNWRLGFYRKVYNLTGTVNTAGSTVTRVAEDGSESVYSFDSGSGLYVSQAGAGSYDTLGYNAATQSWTWTDGNTRVTEKYDAANGGRLAQVLDADGNGLTFTYNASGFITQVVDASGETTYLDYSGANLTQLRTVNASGQTLVRTRYSYDASNRLTQVVTDRSPEDASVADGNAYTVGYTYDGTSRRVATMTQSDGTSVAFTYVQVGTDSRVATITDALGQVTSFAYDTVARTTTVTDALGLATVVAYDAAGQLTGVTGPAVTGGASQVVSYAYDAQGNVASVTDANGNVVTYQYDASGNRVLERDAAGNTVTRVFGAKNELLAQTVYLVPDPDGAGAGQPGTPLTSRYAYDANNHVRFAVSADGKVTEYRYNGFGQQVAVIQYTGSRYDVSALSSTQALTEAQLVAWLPADKSASVRVDTAYDFRGQVSSATSYAKVDAAGNGVADGTQSAAQYVYDQFGNLLKRVDPRGTATADPADYTTTYVYDGMARVLSTTDALGVTTVTQYDDANRKTVMTLSNGLINTSTYDAAGRLISFLQSKSTGALGETKYFYDADGRPRRTEDPTGVKTHVLYDEAGRRIGAIDGDGSLTEYRYDANNNVAKTIRYATAVSATALAWLTDINGKPTNVALATIRPAASTADRVTFVAYDAANRPVKSVDEAGYVTQTFYDGAGRATDVVRYATAIATGTLTDTPAPSAINPTAGAADRLSRVFYDADGKPRGTLDGEGYLVEYKYDAAGEVVETIGYATATNPSLRATGTLAQLIPAAAAGDVHNYMLYNARGQLAGAVDGEGYLTENVYDVAGNKTQVIRYATKVTYAAGATLASLRPAANAQDQVTSTTYTALDRVASQTAVDGTVTQYTYNDQGLLFKTVKAANTSGARALRAKHDLRGRLTGELSARGAALLTGNQTQAEIDAVWAAYGIDHTYDSAGRRTSTTDADGHKTLYYYNADGQLTHTVNALGEVTESVYNALGQVTQTTRYGTRLSAATLATLSGGLVNGTLTAAVTALANAALDSKTTFAYTTKGQLAQTTDALGNAVTQAFNAFGEMTGSSQAIGGGLTLDHTYSYDRRGLLTQSAWDPDGANTATSTVYDAFGRAIQTTDPRGNVRSASYDKLGRTVATTNPPGGTTATTYDAFGRVLTQTDALGKITSYSYDTANRTVRVTTPEGIVTTTTYSRHGETLSITDGRGNTTTYRYDDNGNLVRTDGPSGTVTSVFDNADLLTESTDAAGTKTTFTYDAANRKLTRTYDAGTGRLNLVTSFAYDAKGQTVSTTGANGVVTQTQFDLKGQVTSVIVDPGTGHLNLTTNYTYDARGKKLTVTEGAGSANPRVTQYAYDKLGRLTQERVDPNGINATTTYAYNKNNSVVKKTDALGNVTRYAYDANDRLVYTVNALGGVVKSEYDADGRVTKTITYANPINLTGLPDPALVSDISARVVANAADETHRYVYDGDGREIYCIDAMNAVTQKIYDANGNVVRTVAYANPIAAGTAMTQAAIAAVLAASANDRASQTVYDAAGRVVYAIDAGNYVAETQYDSAGRVTKSIQYTQAISVGGTPTLAQVAAAIPADAAKQVNTFAYDAAGRLVSSTDAEGYSESFTYDAVGNKLSFTNKKSSTWNYAYDANGRMTGELSPAVDVTTVTDNAGTIGTSSATARIETRIAYDALGNVLSRTEAYGRPEARTTQYQYDALGRQIKTTFPTVSVYAAASDSLTTNGINGTVARVETAVTPQSTVTFDVLGNAVVGCDAAGSYSYKVYDVMRRVKYEIDAERYVTENTYDGFGNKASVTRYATALNFGAITGYAAHADGAAFTAAEVAARLAPSSADRIITTVYDTLNRGVQVTEPAVYTYDSSATGSNPQYFTVGRTTRNTYNAFGQVVKQSTLRNPGADQLVGTADDSWADTYFYYDARGNRTASVDALGYLTIAQYDETGDMVRKVEYAQALAAGTWSLSGYAAPVATTPQSAPGSAIGYDRETTYQYDRKNQKTAETRVNAEFGTLTGTPALGTSVGNLTTTYAYDGVGNTTAVTDPTGATTYTYYDALGRVVATAEPARFSDGGNGVIVMPPVYVNYDNTSNTTTLTFAKNAPTDAVVVFQYKVAGAAAWTTAALQVQGTNYTVNLTGLPTDSYQYQLTYTKTGASSPFATGTGQFTVIGPSAATASTNVAAVVEQPSFSINGIPANAHYDWVSAGEGGYTPIWDGSNAVSLSWSSLNALGTGNVRVRINYLTYQWSLGSVVGTGIHTYADNVFSTTAATGATVSWTEAETGYGGIAAIDSVQVWKVVNGVEVLVVNSASSYVQSDRLLLRGNTTGLTGINVAGVGTLAATSLGGGVYVVSLGGLNRGTYSFTPVGTTFAVGGTFDVTHSTAAGNAGVQEMNAIGVNRTINAFRLPASAASAVLQYRPSGNTGPYLSKVLNAAGTGEFSVSYDDIANGSYDYILTVRDSAGNLLDLTSVGGTASGTVSGTMKIRRGGDLPSVVSDPSAMTLTPLTVVRYNAFGNAVQTTKFTKGAVNADATSYTVPFADVNDQITFNVYDSYGHIVRSVDPEGASKYSSYDVLGNVAKTWQPITNNDGQVNNAVQVFQYDKLGHQTATIEPSYTPTETPIVSGAPVADSLAVGWSAGSSTWFNGGVDESGVQHYYWYGWNGISVSWNNMASWGGGNIYARVYYYTGNHNATYQDSEVGPNATGTSWSWFDPGYTDTDGGIWYVYAVQIWKRDVNGTLRQIQYRTTQGANGYEVSFAVPQQPGTGAAFKYSLQGQTTWSNATLYNMGGRYVVDTSGLNGAYNYEILYTRPSETLPYARSQGTMSVSGSLVTGLGINDSTATSYALPPLNPANFSTAQVQYNVFGEITSRGLNNGAQEYYQYDNAGHLWRTNDRDGLDKVLLYDVQGKTTAQILSQTLDLRNGYSTASQIAALTSSVQRTNSVYDALERVLQQTQPSLAVAQPAAAVYPAALGMANASLGIGWYSGAHQEIVGQGETGYIWAWNPNSGIGLGWSDISYLGGGNVYVYVDYIRADGTAGAYAQEFGSGSAATGVSMGWQDWDGGWGTGYVYRVRVGKRDVSGNVIWLFDQGGSGSYSNQITSVIPPEVGTAVTANYKVAAATTWAPIAIYNMGARYLVSTLGWGANTYDLEVLYRRPDQATPYAHSTARFANAGGGITDTTTEAGVTVQTFVPIMSQTVDRWGNALSVTDPNGYVTNYRYNYLDKMLEEKKPETDVWGANGLSTRARPVVRNFYDKTGRGLGTIDANGNTNAARYDAAGQLINEYHADGGVLSYQYDAFGRRTRVIDALGKFTDSVYDRNDRLIQVKRPIGIESYAYDEAGNRIRVTDALGLVTKYWYDTRGKVILSQLPGGQVTATYYDLRGNKIREVTANNDQPVWGYDYFGRLLSHTDMGNGTFTYAYDKAGHMTQQTLVRAGTTAVTTYQYYENGSVKRVFDGGVNGETFYEYDAAGNRTRERYVKSNNGTNVVYRDDRSTYDELGRVQTIRDNRVQPITYKYDANGNRRSVDSFYYDNNNALQHVTSWYLYDGMNRITLSQGVLVNGVIQISASQGIQLQYDAASNRRVATNYQGGALITESYNYDDNGRLTTTNRGGQVTSSRVYDLDGRATQQISYSSPGAINEIRENSYDVNSKLTQQLVRNGAGTVTQATTYTGYDGMGNTTSYQTSVYTGTNYTNYYSYAYAKYDSYKEQNVYGSSTLLQPGSTTTTYDINGNILTVSDQFAANKFRSFVTDGNGMIVQKTENGSTQYYFYQNDKPIGSSGALSAADFDYNYTPVSQQYPGTVPGSYIVSKGDTLRSIALALFGDAQLWYVIADANGMRSDSDLKVGQQLTVPNKITNIHNDNTTFKVYNPTEIIGDTTPTLPDPPPPPQPRGKKGKCGGLAMILIIVVAIVVTIFTAGAALAVIAPAASAGMTVMGAGMAALGGSLGFAGMAAAAIGAAVGSIASQAVAIGLGVQEKFNWGAVATSALTAGFTAGVGAYAGAGGIAGQLGVTGGIGQAVVNGAINNVVGQGINILTGQQQKFDWRGVAAAAVSAPIANAVGGAVGGAVGNATGSAFAGSVVQRFVSGAISQNISVAFHGGGKVDYRQIAADAFGNAVAGAIVSELAKPSQQASALDSAGGSSAGAGGTVAALSYASAGGSVSYGGGGLVTTSASQSSDPMEIDDVDDYVDDIDDADGPQQLGGPDETEPDKAPNNSPQVIQAGRSAAQGFWGIAKEMLSGVGATNQEIQEYAQKLMQMNPDVDPRSIRLGQSIVLPDIDTQVDDTTRARYNKSDADYQQYRAEQAAKAAEAAEAQRAAEAAQSAEETQPKLGPEAPPSGTEGPHGHGEDNRLIDPKDWYKLGVAAYAARAGFLVKEVADEARVYGSKLAKDLLDLPENFTRSALDNEKLLAAKSVYLNATAAAKSIIDDFKPTRVGGAIALATMVWDVGKAVNNYNESAGTASDRATMIGEAGEAVVGTGIKTVATAGAVLLGATAVTAVVGVSAVATAPVWLTVGAAVGVGVLVGMAYDHYAKDTVKSWLTPSTK